MNKFERDIGGTAAVLEYFDGEYRVVLRRPPTEPTPRHTGGVYRDLDY